MHISIKKAIKWFLIVGLVLLVIVVSSYAWRALPIISGYGGQHIFIIPSKKLVVVRTGLQRIDGNKFLKEVIAAIRE